ncbi:MAG: AsmA family protein, partial [Bacteroidales bacterium]|nr:AsmA family protein [Bacteroidales bacterium]
MKKVLKIIGIVLASLIVLIAVSGLIAFNFVMTPKKITPLVNKKVAEYSPFPAKTESVDITFFKTFPDVSLHLDNTLVNSKVTSDTMAYINDLFLSVN